MLDQLIIKNIAYNDEYARKVLPFLKESYFSGDTERHLYKIVYEHFTKYNRIVTPDVLLLEADKIKGISDDQHSDIVELVKSLTENVDDNVDWLVAETEKFCQDKAIYNAVMSSIKILDGSDKQLDKGSIPDLLSTALAVSFDNHIGHDFIGDSEERYEFYHRVEDKIPFDLEFLNKITKGGLSNKTLNIILAGTGVGKSLAMCHFASHYLSIGMDVLYITLEMSEEKIAERIDANLLNVSLDELIMLPHAVYTKKMARVREKTTGRLIIKEYPTGAADANNFRYLISELKLKRKFKPRVVIVDYLNICKSARLKFGANVNSYLYVKAIAEELRGLAIELDVPLISATQTTRSGFSNTDVGLEDTSESFGLPATADLMLALITTEELAEMNQILCKQLKNRYNDISRNRRFVLGVDKSKMRLYNVEQSAQEDIVDDSPAFDKSPTGKRLGKSDPSKFESFN